ncbi:hypothetical protein EJ02DRAFT_354701 [Clathrospora elynae]|uniref:S-adenosyl-L-methionine-dependent methyltransferase n=1 Tax=Clathrospora elynae TaxID=706981 RepID=A0A6A5SFJ7_9PLEO|nr:hypothetical protein EJ02DRAFT_354701 [Clathrospora elynae]
MEPHTPTQDAQELPPLTATPSAYPGCCLGLSAPLVHHLCSLLPPSPSLTLSIGSGFGLLEALLAAKPHANHVIGVEVAPTSNIFLPAADHRVVHGSRFLDPLAAEAAAWLFVYPRRIGLVREYLAEYGEGAVERVVWAGPQADWEDYRGCFEGWGVETRSAGEVGGRAWEVIAVARRRHG